jgi:hypothetical protein
MALFDKYLRRLDRVEELDAKANPPAPPPVHCAVAATWRELLAAARRARAAGADLVVHALVHPKPQPERPPLPEPERRLPDPAIAEVNRQAAEQRERELADPYGFARMSLDELRTRSYSRMPVAERHALEDALNERTREARQRRVTDSSVSALYDGALTSERTH